MHVSELHSTSLRSKSPPDRTPFSSWKLAISVSSCGTLMRSDPQVRNLTCRRVLGRPILLDSRLSRVDSLAAGKAVAIASVFCHTVSHGVAGFAFWGPSRESRRSLNRPPVSTHNFSCRPSHPRRPILKRQQSVTHLRRPRRSKSTPGSSGADNLPFTGAVCHSGLVCQ